MSEQLAAGPFRTPNIEGMTLHPYLIHAGSASNLVQIVREIRNECRMFMTRHVDEITQGQQAAWWSKFDHTRARLYLYMYPDLGSVGFGYVRKDDHEKVWITGGLIDGARGQGLGRDIFRHLTAHSDVVWLEVRKTNVRARRLYESLGYVCEGAEDGIMTMVWRRGIC